MKSLLTLLLLFSSFAHSETDENYNKIQHFAQELHHYVSDQDQYGQLDYWSASLTGDCEDYALWVRSIVGGDLVLVKTSDGQLHMVLKVGDVIFDNMSKDVYNFKDMPHEFLAVYPDNHPDLIAFN